MRAELNHNLDQELSSPCELILLVQRTQLLKESWSHEHFLLSRSYNFTVTSCLLSLYFINTINQLINKPSLSTCPTFSSSSETANCFFFFGFNFQYMTKAAFLTALSKSVSDDNFFTSCSFSEVMPQEKKNTLQTIIPHPCRNDRFAHNLFFSVESETSQVSFTS